MTETQRRSILVEVVKKFGNQEWFRDAVVYDKDPTTGDPTLELKVNYVPVFARKEIIGFAQSVNLMEKFTVVDVNGNPVQ